MMQKQTTRFRENKTKIMIFRNFKIQTDHPVFKAIWLM